MIPNWVKRYWKTAIAITAIIGGLTGALGTWAAFYSTVEPFVPVYRGYLRDYTTPTAKRVTELAISLNEMEQRRLVGDLRNLENEMKSDLAMKTPQYKAALQLGVDQMNKDLSSLEAQHKKLQLEIGERL